jgi:hypothetical protein
VTRSIAAAGAALVSLDSIMNIAFPAIAAAFAVPPERMRWVIICYVFTYALTALAAVPSPIASGTRAYFSLESA